MSTVAALATMLGVLALPMPASAVSQTAFRNPIAPLRPGVTTTPASGLDSPDPWIFTFRGRYYLTQSGDDHILLRSAPTIGGLAGAPLRTLWPRPGTVLPPSRCCEFWAPEIHRLHGPNGWRWYIYSAADDDNLFHHQLQVLQSARDDPRGPYLFKAMLALGPDYEIDPTAFVIRGREYVIYSDAAPGTSFPAHLALARLRNPWTVDGHPLTISSPTQPWELTGFGINEGPEVLRHGPWLHVIYSASACLLSTYKLGRLTIRASANLLDPRVWAPAKAPEPVFQSDPARGVWNTGHGSFFKSPDGSQDWQVYHATDNPSFGCFSGFRTTRAQRFTWNRDGTPNFGLPVSLSTELPAPAGDPTLERQLENAPVVASTGASSSTLADPNFVGEAGTSIVATRAGGSVTYALNVPTAGRYRILVRLATGPDRGQITLRISSRRQSWPLGTRSAHASTAGVAELDYGSASLPARLLRFRFTLGSRGPASLDQIRLEK